LFWDKGVPEGVSFADGELAWTSFDKTLKKINLPYSGFRGLDEWGKIHPTQKPIKLYQWLLRQFAKEGDKILDTHVGSFSSLMACHDMKYDFIGFEIDPDYFREGYKRYNKYISQVRFDL
jgi:site-specific DNA-methyltransferase (adenine-specific)